MILAYIAGKFTAATHDEIESHIVAAEEIARRIIIETNGRVFPVVPHSLGRSFKSGPGDYEFWVKATLELLKRCDVLVCVPGWETSRGAIGEVEWCRRKNVVVYETVEEFLQQYGGEA